MANHKLNDFNGKWRCTHWYPSKDDSAEESTSHIMDAHQDGNTVVLQNTPDGEKSYLLVRLTIDGKVASGSWHETTPPSSDYEGVGYSGAGQLIVSDDGRHMEGLWAGAGLDHKLGKMRIYTDKWALERLE